MLQSIGDHMSMMDKDLNIIWANKIAKEVFGVDIIGKKCYEVYHQRKEPCEPYNHDNCKDLHSLKLCAIVRREKLCLTKNKKPKSNAER